MLWPQLPIHNHDHMAKTQIGTQTSIGTSTMMYQTGQTVNSYPLIVQSKYELLSLTYRKQSAEIDPRQHHLVACLDFVFEADQLKSPPSCF